MTPAQQLAAERGISISQAARILREAGRPSSGIGPGKPHPCPLALLALLAKVREAREQWGGALSPRREGPGGISAASLCAMTGVERTTVRRWLDGVDRPSPRHQRAVESWCRRVLAEAKRLAAKH